MPRIFLLLFILSYCTPPTIDKALVPASKEGNLLYRDKNILIYTYGFKKAFAHWESLFRKRMEWNRIPFLTYLYYEITASPSEKISFHLFRSYLKNDLGEIFPPYTYEDFKKHFPSESYRGISYKKFFGFYILTEKGKKKLLFPPWEEITLDQKLRGMQVVPYAFISQGSRFYTLHIQFPWGEVKKKFYYKSFYDDWE